MTRYLSHGLALCGTFLGIAFGLLLAVTNHNPNWLEQSDFSYRAIVISIGVFALIGMAMLSCTVEGDDP